MAARSEVLDDSEVVRLREGIAALDDETLVFVMLGLNAEMDGVPGWGKAPEARTARRLVFTEIATRWIPPQVFDSAVRQILGGEEAGDA